MLWPWQFHNATSTWPWKWPFLRKNRHFIFYLKYTTDKSCLILSLKSHFRSNLTFFEQKSRFQTKIDHFWCKLLTKNYFRTENDSFWLKMTIFEQKIIIFGNITLILFLVCIFLDTYTCVWFVSLIRASWTFPDFRKKWKLAVKIVG